MKPYIVRGILDENQQRINTYDPQRIRQVVSAQTAGALSDLFCSVVDRGTGVEAQVPGLRIAGKTGTAQQLVDGKYSKQAYTASFIGYFPADSAEMVLLVMLDKPKTDIYGGKTAAPIFRSIVRRILSTPSVHEDYPALSRMQAQTASADSCVVPDLRGMSLATAQEIIRKKSLRSTADASQGIIQTQSPGPGTVLSTGSEVHLVTRSSAPQSVPAPQSAPTSVRTMGGMPDVRGLSVRRAVTILHANNIVVRIQGSGRIREQRILQENGKQLCVLVAQ